MKRKKNIITDFRELRQGKPSYPTTFPSICFRLSIRKHEKMLRDTILPTNYPSGRHVMVKSNDVETTLYQRL